MLLIFQNCQKGVQYLLGLSKELSRTSITYHQNALLWVRILEGIGRLFGLHLLLVKAAPGQMKPPDALESRAAAKSLVGSRQRLQNCFRGLRGQRRGNPFPFRILSSPALSSSLPLDPGDAFLPCSVHCQGGIGTGRCDPVGQAP